MDAAQYVQGVLDAYRATPGACGMVRKPDRAFAMALFARGVPLDAVDMPSFSQLPDAPCAGPTPRPWASSAPWLTSVL